jgi:hypothetical protein
MPYKLPDMPLSNSPVFDGTKSDKLITPRNNDRRDEGTKKTGELDADSKKGPEFKK